jgi:glutamate carboxypeptidase
MGALSNLEQAAVEHAAAAPMLDQVQAWAAINSGSRNLPGLARMAGIYADAFSAFPGELALRDAAPVEAMRPDGRLEPLEHGRNLHLKVRPEAPVQLLFTGHMDTVYAADHVFQELAGASPASSAGPGVADMKGGIAVLLAALRAVEASPAAGSLGYEVVINSDEEVGSPGSAPLLAAAARGKRAALTYEPSALPDGTLAGARPGSGNFSIRIEGRSAHAGRNPEDGRNALLAAADLALRLAACESGRPLGQSRPDRRRQSEQCRARSRHPARQHAAAHRRAQAHAQAALDEAVAAVAAAHEVRATVHGGFGRPPKPLGPRCRAPVRPGRALRRGSRPAIGWRASGGVCDGNNIAACGVPVVDTMGVRGGAIHSSDEYLIVDSLPERAALSALTILRLASGAPL